MREVLTAVPPGLRYLDAPTVERHLPTPAAAIDLALRVLERVGGEAAASQPKVSVPPNRLGTFAQAMPAQVDGWAAPAGHPLLGMKWIGGNPGNRARGLPAMGSLVVLNDPMSGLPVAILDGSPITACRTAALSAAAIRVLARPGTPPHAALVLGAGVQGRAHVAALAACGVSTIWVYDRHPDRSREVAEVALRPVAETALADGANVSAVDGPRSRMAEADVLISVTSLVGGVPWVGPGDVARDAIVVPVDYGAQVRADLVASAGLFVVDDRQAWRENRERGRLPDWPDPADTLVDVLGRRGDGEWSRPPGVAVALHQGPGLADVMFAAAVLRSAIAAGEGLLLP